MTTKKCEQIKCGFLHMGGCKPCDSCKSAPFIVDENCDRCWNCEHDEGILRWDDDSVIKEEKQVELVPMEVKIK